MLNPRKIWKQTPMKMKNMDFKHFPGKNNMTIALPIICFLVTLSNDGNCWSRQDSKPAKPVSAIIKWFNIDKDISISFKKVKIITLAKESEGEGHASLPTKATPKLD